MLRQVHLLAALIVLVALLSCSALAEKITVDPNAPGAQVESQSEDIEVDERVAQRVTLQVSRTSVKQILSILSEQTGVSLKAGLNQDDWQVRDRRMNIFCEDLPLSNLMNSIARVMKFKWGKETLKDGTYTYRLYMDRKALLNEEARRAREEEQLAKIETAKRQKAIDSIDELADMTPQEIEKLRDENPFLYVLGKAGIAKPLRGFFGAVPSLAQALAKGQSMEMPASALSAQARSYAIESLKALWTIKNTADGRSEPFGTADVNSTIDQAIIRVNPNLERFREMQEGSFILGEIRIGPPDRGGIEIPLFDPETNLAKLVGEMILTAEETGQSIKDSENRQEMQQKFVAAMASDVAERARELAPEEPKAVSPDEPDLHAKVKIKPDSNDLPDVLSALSNSSKMPVVSDSFRQTIVLSVPKDKEMDLWDLLEKIGESFRYDWDKPGSVLEFRDKKWFKKRAAQIPDSWIERWRDTLKKTGTLELGDLVQICSLTQEQFNENIQLDKVLMSSGIVQPYYLGREALKLYGMLSEAQRAMAWGEEGLDLTLLGSEQWAQAAKAIKLTRPGLVGNRDVALRLRVIQKQPDGSPDRARYNFKITADDGSEPLVWQVDAPKYEDPQKPKKVDTNVEQ